MGMDLLRSALTFLLRRFDIVLHADQDIDWYVHTMLLPRADIQVRFTAPGGPGQAVGRWRGAVSDLLNIP
ncbi:hypothetical protein LP419_21420 [Massilia sp. H-1]|nr:hypothetical protein LP419_21420 [Massilia sp. H-1]